MREMRYAESQYDMQENESCGNQNDPTKQHPQTNTTKQKYMRESRARPSAEHEGRANEKYMRGNNICGKIRYAEMSARASRIASELVFALAQI